MKISSLILMLFTFSISLSQVNDSASLILALNNLKDNDKVVINDGVYENIDVIISNKHSFEIAAKNPGKVIIKGKSNFLFSNCSNFIIQDIHFKETKSKELISLDNSKKGLIINNLFEKCAGGRYASVIGMNNNSSNNVVKNNSFKGIMTIGIAIKDNNIFNEISFNSFLDVPSVLSLFPNSDGNGMECIQLGRGAEVDSYSKVYYNYFENVYGDGAEIISVKSNQNSISSNYFKNSKGGVTLRIGNDNTINDNHFLGTSHPIRVFGENHLIYNNYFIDASVAIQFPAANAESKNKNKAINSYSRSRNIEIYDNFFKGVKKSVLIGNGMSKHRNLLPSYIIIKNNHFGQKEWLEITSKDTKLSIKTFDNSFGDFEVNPCLSLNKVGVNWY